MALNKVGFYSNDVQTMVPSVEPSGASDNEGSALIKYGEALQQLLDQKLQAKAQFRAEIDLKRAAGWAYADLRPLTRLHKAQAVEIRALESELATLAQLNYRWISALRA